MPQLSFAIEDARPEPHAAAPLLLFRLRVTNATGEPIHGALLRCQVRIEPAARRYEAGEAERLRDVFGPREMWGDSQRPLLWTHVSHSLPSFTGSATVDLPVPCSLDLNAAGTKLFRALEGGEVPLLFLFSGTVFFASASGALQVAQVPWELEARFRLPVATWQSLVDLHYPDQAFLLVRKDFLTKLDAVKVRRGFPTWEQALESLLA